MNPNLRKIERLEDEQWVVVRMRDLVPGDTFRMPFRESDAEAAVFEATGDPYPTDDNEVWGIDCRFIRLDEDQKFIVLEYYHNTMLTEVTADCYSGPDCDQVTKRFHTYCDGDMDSEYHTDDIVIQLKDLPVGARIKVEYPCCPNCSHPREDEFEMLPGAVLKIVGHSKKCTVCNFDWENWDLEQYS